jgi:hypothetical protein
MGIPEREKIGGQLAAGRRCGDACGFKYRLNRLAPRRNGFDRRRMLAKCCRLMAGITTSSFSSVVGSGTWSTGCQPGN